MALSWFDVRDEALAVDVPDASGEVPTDEVLEVREDARSEKVLEDDPLWAESRDKSVTLAN